MGAWAIIRDLCGQQMYVIIILQQPVRHVRRQSCVVTSLVLYRVDACVYIDYSSSILNQTNACHFIPFDTKRSLQWDINVPNFIIGKAC